MPYQGELAAILSALSWTISSLIVERRGKAYSPWSLNALTKLGGLLTVSLLAFLMMGQFFPRASAAQWGMLLLSGFLGFSLGDGFLYAAFQTLGAKRTLLIFSANPVLTALFGWIFLGEALMPAHLVGILLAVAGIMWVIRADMGEQGKPEQAGPTITWQGLLFAALATLGQAAGALLSKAAMASLEAIPASQIRLIGGVLGSAVLLSLTGQWKTLPAPLLEKRGRGILAVSVLLGTLVGMVLSMLAIKLTQVAIASILMSLMPVMILPIEHFILKERVRPREVMGAVLTLLGVGMLFV